MDKRLHPLPPLPPERLQQIGLEYCGPEGEDYLANEWLDVSFPEGDVYREATNTLQGYYNQATDAILQAGNLRELGIPAAAEEVIYHTWANRQRHFPVWGRFDLAGVLDGSPPALIEYNADLASMLAETASIALEYTRQHRLPVPLPFDHLFSALVQRLRQLAQVNGRHARSLLISTMGHPEDEANAHVLALAAREADFEVVMAPLEEVIFSPEEGIFLEENDGSFSRFPFFLKYFPWDFVAVEEPELLHLLTQIVLRDQAVVVNPGYCMLWQSKAMLAHLWQQFPGAPYLLPTFMAPPPPGEGPGWVRKPFFGRLGENIRIMDAQQRILAETLGAFSGHPCVWQQYQALPQDSRGNVYQAQVFFTAQPVGLSFRRRNGLIVDDEAEFVPVYKAY